MTEQRLDGAQIGAGFQQMGGETVAQGVRVTGLPWGGLLGREGRQYMEQAPWLALWPGLCLTLAVSSLNLFGDAIRDLLDPRLKGGLGRLGAGM